MGKKQSNKRRTQAYQLSDYLSPEMLKVMAPIVHLVLWIIVLAMGILLLLLASRLNVLPQLRYILPPVRYQTAEPREPLMQPTIWLWDGGPSPCHVLHPYTNQTVRGEEQQGFEPSKETGHQVANLAKSSL